MSLLARIIPNQAGVLWIAGLIVFAAFGDLRRLFSRYNFRLALALLLGPLLYDVQPLGRSPHAALVWTLIFAITGVYFVWALLLSRRGPYEWHVRMPRNGLLALLAALIVLDAAETFGRPPDDAGRYTNLGTQRWLETGSLPYADTLLTGPGAVGRGAAATYGPVLYAAHMPLLLVARPPRNASTAIPGTPAYTFPPPYITQTVCFAFFLLGMAAMYLFARREAGPVTALAVLVIWASSPFLLGVGGEAASVGGLRYISHIAPTAFTLLALVLLGSPVLAGVSLALAAGALFFPVFFFPAWLGWYLWRDARQALRFVVGSAAAGVLILAFVYFFTHPPHGENVFRLFFENTFGHQEGSAAGQYGASHFGFWGTHPQATAFWQRPLAGSSFFLRPVFVLYALLVAASFLLARGRSPAQLAALTAALSIGTQLWKTHGGGTYVGWYYPLLLIAIFAGQRVQQETAEARTGSPHQTASDQHNIAVA